ncbi:hypothetical protein CBS101457_002805 [Exobasidium rhododendri]|nr:hypothetical protein CBS101457_002805 [Exobasidium rhododendri]
MRNAHLLVSVLLICMIMVQCQGSPAPPEISRSGRLRRAASGNQSIDPPKETSSYFDESTPQGRREAFFQKMIDAGIDENMDVEEIVAATRNLIQESADPHQAGRSASDYLRSILTKKQFEDYRRQSKYSSDQPSKKRFATGQGGQRSTEKVKERAKTAKDLEKLLASKDLTFDMSPIGFAKQLKKTDFNIDRKSLLSRIGNTLIWKERHEGFDTRWREAYTKFNIDVRNQERREAMRQQRKSVVESDPDTEDEGSSTEQSEASRPSRHHRTVSLQKLYAPRQPSVAQPILGDWKSFQRTRSMNDRVGKAPVLQFGYGEDYGNAGQAEYEEMTQAFHHWPTSSPSEWHPSEGSSYYPPPSPHNYWGDHSHGTQEYSGQAASSSDSEPPIVPVDPVTGRSRVSSERRLKPSTKPPGALY